jgi:predicted RNA-binding Zn ribbon-like protein
MVTGEEPYNSERKGAAMTADVQKHHFKLIGGELSLDFVNTAGGWGSRSTRRGPRDYRDVVLRDRLNGYGAVVAWGRHTGLITDKEATHLLRLAEQQGQAAAAALERAVRLREAVYRLFRAVVENWPPPAADVEKLNQELAIARTHERLIYAKDGYSLVWGDRRDALDCMLWPLAQSAVELLTSGDLSRIKQCGSDECGWLFFDTSRNRSRQWCDMKDCGNLAKVRRFRQRQR